MLKGLKETGKIIRQGTTRGKGGYWKINDINI